MPPQRTKPALAILLCLLCGWAASLVAEPATDQPAVDEAMRAIRLRYEEINGKTAKYRMVKKELGGGFSAEGGTLVASFRDDALVKIELTFYGERGETAEEYYYTDGKLIFLYQANSDYDKLNSGRIVHTEKTRCYFRDDVLIAWIDGHGKPVPPSTSQYANKQAACLQDARGYSRAARSTQPTV